MIRIKTVICALFVMLAASAAYAGQNTTKQILATQTANLQAYYRCNDADGLLQDSSGNARPADVQVLAASVYAARGKDGTCITYASGAYQYRTSSVLGAAPTNFTIMAWFKSVSSTNQTIFGFGCSSNAQPMIQVSQVSNQLSSIVRNAAGTSRLNVASLGVINDGNWHHVALVYNGTSFITYLDGTAVNTTAGTSDVTTLDRTGIGVLVRDTISSPVQGSIQHLAAWNVAITGTEITNIYGAAKFTGPDITALPGSPTSRYYSSYEQFEYDSTTRQITTWADSTGNGNNLVGGSSNLGQSKPLAAFDPDGRSGVFIQKDSIQGFEAPTSLSGNAIYGAVLFCCRNEYERNFSICRMFELAGLNFSLSANGSTPSDKAPRFGTDLENRLPCTHQRSVIGFISNGTAKKLFWDGVVYDITNTNTSTSVSGGFLGQKSAYNTDRWSGYIHDLAIWTATSSAGVPSNENFLAAANAMMTTWGVTSYDTQDVFVQGIGDSMSNGGDGSGDYPSGWADRLKLPSVNGRYQIHVDGVPGWKCSDVTAAFTSITGRKTVLNKRYNIALIIIGTNDVSAVPTDAITAITGLWQSFKNAGYIVIGATIPPQGGYSAQVQTINAGLRASLIPDYFIDAERGLPAMFGPGVVPGSNSLYVDTKHPTTPTGYGLYADYVQAKADGFVNTIVNLNLSNIASQTSPAAIRAALGLSNANIDTQFTTVAGKADAAKASADTTVTQTTQEAMRDNIFGGEGEVWINDTTSPPQRIKVHIGN